MSLEQELASLINIHSAENESNTPDYILASFMSDCIVAFNRAVNQREAWYGRKTQESEEPVNSPASPVQQLKFASALFDEIDKALSNFEIDNDRKLIFIINSISKWKRSAPTNL